MLLVSGSIIYHNNANIAIEYFSSIGYTWPLFTNPADYFMSIMSIEAYNDHDSNESISSNIEDNYLQKILFLCQSYENSDSKVNTNVSILNSWNFENDYQNKYSASIIKQFCYLYARDF